MTLEKWSASWRKADSLDCEWGEQTHSKRAYLRFLRREVAIYQADLNHSLGMVRDFGSDEKKKMAAARWKIRMFRHLIRTLTRP